MHPLKKIATPKGTKNRNASSGLIRNKSSLFFCVIKFWPVFCVYNSKPKGRFFLERAILMRLPKPNHLCWAGCKSASPNGAQRIPLAQVPPAAALIQADAGLPRTNLFNYKPPDRISRTA
jgi:hypothetical protein